MPVITWRLTNPPRGANNWSGEFVKVNEDGTTTILARPDRDPAQYMVTEPITFSNFTGTTGFFVFEIVGNGPMVEKAFPGFNQNMVLPQQDSMFTLDGGGTNLVMWLVVGGLVLGLVVLGSRSRR